MSSTCMAPSSLESPELMLRRAVCRKMTRQCSSFWKTSRSPSVKGTRWASLCTFTLPRMISSQTPSSPNRLIPNICENFRSFQRWTFQYDMKCLPDPEDPFSFEGPEIFKCVGCPIDWLPGKNLTVKQVNTLCCLLTIEVD